MSNQNLVRVIDNLSGSTLMETTLDKIQDAYTFAAMMEEVGLDIKIEAPGLAETLITSLGASDEEVADYRKSLDQEINDHNDEFGDEFGCAVCPPKKYDN